MADVKIKAGLVCVGLEGERNDLARGFRKIAEEELLKRGVRIVNQNSPCTLTGAEVMEQSQKSETEGADVVIYLVGTWILADHIVDAILRLKIPFVIWGIPEPASFSSVGANVVHGTLGEMGISHKMIYGMPDEEETMESLMDFLKAVAVYRKLQTCRLGVIGGKTISAYPTTADEIQIKKIFGTEIVHIDQMVLYEKAVAVPVEMCRSKIEELKRTVKAVDVRSDILLRSVSVYFALKELISKFNLDMVSVQCIGEFMDRYSSCCLALALLNDEGYICGCQCNINAMLSTYILRKLSNAPVFFGDINLVLKKEKIARLINCGSIPMSLAESKKKVAVVEQYDYMGNGGGACTFFCCKPGKVTFGTLGRVQGEYVMNIASGEAFMQPDEKLKEARHWAQGFVKLDCDPMVFYSNIRCNHSVMCYGDVKGGLIELCRLYSIRPETTLQ